MSVSAVTLTSLTESAIKYQKDLKMLPYAVMSMELGRMGVTLFPGVQNKDVITEFQRKQGIMRPYAGSVANQTVGKAKDAILEVKTAYASVKDSIKNYQKYSVGPDDLLGKNKSKKHPWEKTMLTSIARTFSEDLLDCLFPGERDDEGTTPLDAFDGFDTIIDDYITSGDIAAGKGNYVATDDITSSNAFDQLLAFYRAANYKLKDANTIMLVPVDIAEMYDDAHFTKHAYKPIVDEFNRTTLTGSGGKCKIVRAPFMGSGDRIILTVPGNLDFGMNTLGDEAFVQVRDIYEDPNYVQFWIQGDYGCRIRSVHEKMFQTNDGTPVSNQLSGDYS